MASTLSGLRSHLPWLLPVVAVCTLTATEPVVQGDQPAPGTEAPEEQKAVQVHYLEIVTPDVHAMCSTLEELHGVEFSGPRAELGNARTAPLLGGGLIGVRSPLRADEAPVVRPYVLVDDLESAVEAARAAGHEIAIPLMEIPELGKIAIYLHGGIEHGLWQI